VRENGRNSNTKTRRRFKVYFARGAAATTPFAPEEYKDSRIHDGDSLLHSGTIDKLSGRYTMQQSELKQLYVDELKDIYSAETQLVKALPKMAKAAVSAELRNGFERHLEQTREHVSRLEQIFDGLDETPTGKHCRGMEGLIKEGSEAAEDDYERDAKDAALIGAAQRVEHYEIAAYGTVRAMAEKLGEDKAVNILIQTLQEEKDTDVKLSTLADKMTIEDDGAVEPGTKPQARKAKGKAARA
jgi:ferritin-like metal-binding protein YciE